MHAGKTEGHGALRSLRASERRYWSQLSPVERCAFIRDICRVVKCMSFVDGSGYKPGSNGSRVAWSFENSQISISSFLITKATPNKLQTKSSQYDYHANVVLRHMHRNSLPARSSLILYKIMEPLLNLCFNWLQCPIYMPATPVPVGRFPTAIICLEAFSEAETLTIWLQGIILLAALHD